MTVKDSDWKDTEERNGKVAYKDRVMRNEMSSTLNPILQPVSDREWATTRARGLKLERQ